MHGYYASARSSLLEVWLRVSPLTLTIGDAVGPEVLNNKDNYRYDIVTAPMQAFLIAHAHGSCLL